MIEFLASVGALALAGLAGIAIKYPKGFSRLYWPLLALSNLIMVGVLLYYFGYSQGGNQMVPYLDRSQLEQALAARNVATPPVAWVIAGSVAFSVFVIFLFALPDILGISKKDGDQGDIDDKG